jgi:hypothetical protein
MKCFSAIVIIAYGVLAIGADALGVHRHRDDEKDNMVRISTTLESP